MKRLLQRWREWLCSKLGCVPHSEATWTISRWRDREGAFLLMTLNTLPRFLESHYGSAWKRCERCHREIPSVVNEVAWIHGVDQEQKRQAGYKGLDLDLDTEARR